MIAADFSSLIAYFDSGDLREKDIARINDALSDRSLALPPPVLVEMLSNPKTSADLRPVLVNVPLLEVATGYWERAADTRAALLTRGFKAALADALIAQACIDADVALITRDKDFRHFEKHCGLKLA